MGRWTWFIIAIPKKIERCVSRMVWTICPPYSMIFSYCSIFSAGCYNLAWIHLTWRCVGFFLLWREVLGGQKPSQIGYGSFGGEPCGRMGHGKPQNERFQTLQLGDDLFGVIRFQYDGDFHTFPGNPRKTNDWKGSSKNLCDCASMTRNYRWSRHGWGNEGCGCLGIAAITWMRIGRSIDALYGNTFMYRCILIILRDLPWLYEKFHCTYETNCAINGWRSIWNPPSPGSAGDSSRRGQNLKTTSSFACSILMIFQCDMSPRDFHVCSDNHSMTPSIWCQLISCDVRWSCCEANDLNISSSILFPIFTVFFFRKPEAKNADVVIQTPEAEVKKAISASHVMFPWLPSPIGPLVGDHQSYFDSSLQGHWNVDPRDPKWWWIPFDSSLLQGHSNGSPSLGSSTHQMGAGLALHLVTRSHCHWVTKTHRAEGPQIASWEWQVWFKLQHDGGSMGPFLQDGILIGCVCVCGMFNSIRFYWDGNWFGLWYDMILYDMILHG